MHRFIRSAAFAAAAVLVHAGASASPTAEALGTCLVDKSTVRDHRDLARWIFAAVSAHPQMQDLFSLNATTRDDINKAAADVFTRLVTVDCLAEARASVAADGANAWGEAFGKLGEVAMSDVVTNRDVMASFKDPIKHLDMRRINKALAPNP